MQTIQEKISAFAVILEAAKRQALIDEGYNPEHHRHAVTIHYGAKFARVDIGDSGKYMVDLATGDIYGIKGYGVVHRGHRYGTLDTTGEYHWGGYVARPRTKEAA